MRIRAHGLHYHVIARCNNGEDLLLEAYDCEYLLEYIRYYIELHQCKLFNYVIMPSHVHLMLSTLGGQQIDGVMHDICLMYAHYYNKRYQRGGHFWRHRYRSKIISDDYYALACLRYIDRNPVAAGLVNEASKWPWSGHEFYAYGKRRDFITAHPAYYLLGDNKLERKMKYRALFSVAKFSDTDDKVLFESKTHVTSRRYKASAQRTMGGIRKLLP